MTALEGVRNLAKAAVRGNRPLVVVAWVMGALGALSLAATFVDPRQLLGLSVWVKPAKFFLSLLIFLFTAAWLLGQVEGWPRLKRWIGRTLIAVASIEMLCIAGQAARGVRSHFNNATVFDTVVSATMGLSIAFLFIATIVLAVLAIRQRSGDPVLMSGIRAGLVVTLLGMSTGYLMVMPTRAQLEAKAKTGSPSTVRGSHTFGAEEGGPGLPFVNWSTEAGDMRPAHFVGLHAMQVLPLLAAFLLRRRTLSVAQKRSAVRVAGIAWAGLTVLLAVQALRHQSIVRPDAWTLAGFGALTAFTVGSFAAIAWSAFRARSRGTLDVSRSSLAAPEVAP